MKRIAYLFLFISTSVFAQIHKDSVTIYRDPIKSFDASKVSDDSTYWFRIRGKSSIDVIVDFSSLSNDSSTLTVYRGYIERDTIYYMNLNSVLETAIYPLTLSASYLNTSEGDTIKSHAIIARDWNADLVGLKLDPTDGSTGFWNVIIRR